MSDIFERAQKCEAEGRLADAIAEYGRLIDDGQGGAVAYRRRGLLHNQLGAFAAMTADLERAHALGDDPYAPMWQGHIAKAMRRKLFAETCLRAALDEAPPTHEQEMRVNLAEAHSVLGWLDSANRLALGLAPDVADWWAGTRRTAIDRYRDNHRIALALLRDRRRTNRTRTSLLDLAKRLFGLGRLRAAAMLCEELMREDPRDFVPFELRSRVAARTGGAEAALAFLLSLGWLHGASPAWKTAVAELLLDLGRFADARDLLNMLAPKEWQEDQRILSAYAQVALDDPTRLGAFCAAWMQSTIDSVPAGSLLIYVYNAMMAQSDARPSLPASPRRLHIVHYWNDPDIPGDVRETIASWQRHNPELDATVFSTAMATEFIATHYDADTVAAFALCRHPAMQADIFRLAFLARKGGLYADADEACQAPMPDILARAAAAEASAVRSADIPGFLHNYFMGSKPGSQTFARAVAMGSRAILKCEQRQIKPDIWHVTGPGLVTRGVGKTLAERLDTATVDDFVLVSLQQYRALVHVADQLAYKQRPSANWRLS